MLIFLTHFWSTYKKKKIDDNGAIATGNIVKLTYNEASFVIIEYEVGGKTYSLEESSYPDTIIGEKYEVKYTISNPAKDILNLIPPYFCQMKKRLLQQEQLLKLRTGILLDLNAR